MQMFLINMLIPYSVRKIQFVFFFLGGDSERNILKKPLNKTVVYYPRRMPEVVSVFLFADGSKLHGIHDMSFKNENKRDK